MLEDSGPVPSTELSRPGPSDAMAQRPSDLPAINGANDFVTAAPALSMPKGGGAVRGIGEKFAINPVTGTGAMSIPIALSSGRGGFGPQLSLNYDSGSGQGVFGLGWRLDLPSITRQTDKGLPRYLDAEESDVFLLSGAEDLVPVQDEVTGQRWMQQIQLVGIAYDVFRYRPRIEGLFARIERWTRRGEPASTFWRSISRDNVTTWYGRDDESRIADPHDPRRIFQWLVCQVHDDKGNVAVYRYANDGRLSMDVTQPWEANRDPATRRANRYLKRILYGNPPPSYLPRYDPVDADVLPANWLFEAVFDYGDHAGEFPLPQRDAPPDTPTPTLRPDAFSSHRAGFEVRTHRLCRRVLMFHHVADAPEVGLNCLVRSTDFDYALADTGNDPTKPGYTVLRAATVWHFQRTPGAAAPYASRQLPPLGFRYSPPVVNPVVRSLAASELDKLPLGTQGPGVRWVDLDGEGLCGVLTETPGGWYYKPNLGDGRFGPLRAVAPLPAMATGSASQQLMDLAGDGEIDVVDFEGPAPGFHERDRDEGWKRHVPFASLPRIDWQDPNLRFVDLTGDGHADALVTEQDVFCWYPSLDERGFGAQERTPQAADEDAGPRLVFADGTLTIFLADLCGDGLTDLVRIRNGEVCYWPNLGHGRFGRKVTLGNSPHFDAPELFDPRRIRLADIDGSGPTDLIYLGRDGARLYFNRSGNRLSDAFLVDLPVVTHNLDAVQVADLFGTGTACLVWNSHLPADLGRPVQFIDLMGEKPHLLIHIDNHLGATTEIEYTPSTHFYLQDREAGHPWATRLPFPVHCVSKLTVRDQWRRSAFSSSYSYHHGYFDGVEREFRGFGRVEQVDTQAFEDVAAVNAGSPFVTADHTLYQPPIKSITWFHTGAADDAHRLLATYAQEYFPARFASQLQNTGYSEPPLSEPTVDDGAVALSTAEWREAQRACKGLPLRSELYELDFDALQTDGRHVPVRISSATQHQYRVSRLQVQGAQRHAVFLALESQSFGCHYETDLRPASLAIDPRITHTLNLRFDGYGRALQSVAVVYPRRLPFTDTALSADQIALVNRVQGERHIAYTETGFTAELPTTEQHQHRLPLACEVRRYELSGDDPTLGFVPGRAPYFSVADLQAFRLSDNLPGQGAKPVVALAHHEQPADSRAHKRLLKHTRSLFFDAGLAVRRPTTHLPFGIHDARALKYEDYQLAFSDTFLDAIFGTKLQDEAGPGETAAAVLADASQSGYLPGASLNPAFAGQHWRRSGIAGFSNDPAYDAAARFFLPTGYTDPFGHVTRVTHDDACLFVRQVTDALGNTTRIEAFDHRVLAPTRVRDANGNESATVFDIRGLPVASALLGKVEPGTAGAADTTETGNTLDGWTVSQLNPSAAELAAFFSAPGLDGRERAWLGQASSRFIYHFGEQRNAAGEVTQWASTPAATCSLVRERHEADLANTPANAIPMQIAIDYADGAGQSFVTKRQAEPETPGGPLRWIASGKTVFNNKGRPVLRYEPYFSTDANGVPDRRFAEPREEGVSPVMFYDAAGRLLRTDFPDGTCKRYEFSPWFSRAFDANDTVLDAGNRWYAEHSASTASPEHRRAAALAARHAGTPTETHLDSLGREVITITHNRVPEAGDDNVPLLQRPWTDTRHLSFTRLDAEGQMLWTRDARGNLAMQYVRRGAPPVTGGLTINQVEPATWVPGHDLTGTLLFQHSMDGGDRWTLPDAAGQPLLAWDRNEFGGVVQNRVFRTRHDALHRPTEQWLTTSDNQQQVNGRFRVEVFAYADTAAMAPAELAEAKRRNLIGRAVRHWDASGRATVERVDVNGQASQLTRTPLRVDPARDNDTALHWPDTETARSALLEADTFIRITEHDALARVTRLYNWHRDISFSANGPSQATPGATNRVSVHERRYDERGALAGEWVHVRAAKSTVAGRAQPDTTTARSNQAIRAITRNARGQQTRLVLGNGTVTTSVYDDNTFRLVATTTRRTVAPTGLQDLRYTYDPAGNIVFKRDTAQETVWHDNAQIDASHAYIYDALYRLVEATGRENTTAPPPTRDGPWPSGSFPSSSLPRPYTQRFCHDEAGNFSEMKQLSGAGNGFTRMYATQPDSNHLLRTWTGAATWNDAAPDQRTEYAHDTHGNLLTLRWDWRDMPCGFDLGGGGIARYHHGSDRQRSRKHITRNTANGGTVVEDRLYLDGYELYRRFDPQGGVVEEIESLHVHEGNRRVLLVDDVVRAATPRTLFRFQYGDRLGSVALELDAGAQIISYEEFHPFGTSAFRLMNAAIEAPARRYRFTGMERDEESGLSYHGARYYLPGLGRWLSPDVLLGANRYAYCNGNPVTWVDLDGHAPASPDGGVGPNKPAIITFEDLQAMDPQLAPETDASFKRRFDQSHTGDWSVERRYNEDGSAYYQHVVFGPRKQPLNLPPDPTPGPDPIPKPEAVTQKDTTDFNFKFDPIDITVKIKSKKKDDTKPKPERKKPDDEKKNDDPPVVDKKVDTPAKPEPDPVPETYTARNIQFEGDFPYFSDGDEFIDESYQTDIDAVADIMKKDPGIEVTIKAGVGFTGVGGWVRRYVSVPRDVGPVMDKRAAKVQSELVKRGIDINRIHPARGDAVVGAQGRKVEFIFTRK